MARGGYLVAAAEMRERRARGVHVDLEAELARAFDVDVDAYTGFFRCPE